MAKRKRTQGASKSQLLETENDPSASKLKFNSYADIADSEDDFHINRDEIMLDGGPEKKRRRQAAEDLIEASDEEVLAYSDSKSEDEDLVSDEPSDDDSDANDDEVSQAEGQVQGEDEINEWGASKADYYNTDVIETEQDALEEEAEARRLQQKRLKALKEADFGFDETEWAGKDDGVENDAEDGRITEVLPQLQITEAMGPSERVKLLKSRYPEFEPLAKQLMELQPLHERLLEAARVAQKEQALVNRPRSDTITPVAVIKLRALSAYLGTLAMYFVVLTSTAKDEPSESLPLAPHIIQNHGVMDSLVRSRENWEMLKDLEEEEPQEEEEPMEAPTAITTEISRSSPLEVERKRKSANSNLSTNNVAKTNDRLGGKPTPAESEASQARRAERLRRTEESLAALSKISSTTSRHQRPAAPASTSLTTHRQPDVDSDIGDEPALTPHEAAEKARRKKSLRFYTSQIAQRANKRANAGRAAGGDDDVPYRERLRDRQDRLMREAENRGKQGKRGVDGTELRDGSDDEPEVTNRERGLAAGAEEAYDGLLEAKVHAKKAAKHAREEAYAEAKESGGRVVRHEEGGIGPDGRREVGYAIEKNKGLMPRRKKDVKNPRVKKRKKFEEKTKKLASMKPVYKGGEGRGGYAGELTGIKKGLVRSVKF